MKERPLTQPGVACYDTPGCSVQDMRGGDLVTTPSDQDEWITIDEAIKLGSASRATLMRRKRKGELITRIERLPTPQAQERLLFRRSDVLPPDREAV